MIRPPSSQGKPQQQRQQQQQQQSQRLQLLSQYSRSHIRTFQSRGGVNALRKSAELRSQCKGYRCLQCKRHAPCAVAVDHAKSGPSQGSRSTWWGRKRRNEGVLRCTVKVSGGVRKDAPIPRLSWSTFSQVDNPGIVVQKLSTVTGNLSRDTVGVFDILLAEVFQDAP